MTSPDTAMPAVATTSTPTGKRRRPRGRRWLAALAAVLVIAGG